VLDVHRTGDVAELEQDKPLFDKLSEIKSRYDDILAFKMETKGSLAEMVTEMMKREIGMATKPLPEQIKTLTTDLPTGKARFESSLYQAEKLKKITISKRSLDDQDGGTVVMIVPDDEYDIPFILADLAFDFAGKGRITAGFKLKPLVMDAQSTNKYIDPFRRWYREMKKLPQNPYI